MEETRKLWRAALRGTAIERCVLQELARNELALLRHLQRVVEDTVAILYPATPVSLASNIRMLDDATVLQKVHLALLHATNQAEVERLLAGTNALEQIQGG